MATAYHPAFSDITREITDDEREAYKAAGWRMSPIPTADEPKQAESTEPPTEGKPKKK